MTILSKLTSNGNENTVNVLKNIANAVVIKGGGIIVGLLTTPAYMDYFSKNEILGIWFTILSVVTWMLNFDLGIGNGLRNRLVEEFACSNDQKIIKCLISSAYGFLLSISVLVGTIVLYCTNFIDWTEFFGINTNTVSNAELNTAMRIVIFSIFLQLVLRLSTSIEYALQKSYIANLLVLVTNTMILIYVLGANFSGYNNNIVILAIAYMLAVNIPLICITIVLFSGKMKFAVPSIRYCKIKYAKETLKLGSLFLIIQLETMLLNNSNAILITKLCGADRVVEYNVYFKVFSLVNTFYALITIPIWSAVTKAMAGKDFVWIKKALRGLQLVAVLFSVGQVAVFPIMQIVIDVWLGSKTFAVSIPLMFCFALEQFFMVWSNLNGSIANGLSELKIQTVLMSIGVFLLFGVSVLLTHISRNYWIILVSHCCALAPYCVIQSLWIEKYLKMHNKSEPFLSCMK